MLWIVSALLYYYLVFDHYHPSLRLQQHTQIMIPCAEIPSSSWVKFIINTDGQQILVLGYFLSFLSVLDHQHFSLREKTLSSTLLRPKLENKGSKKGGVKKVFHPKNVPSSLQIWGGNKLMLSFQQKWSKLFHLHPVIFNFSPHYLDLFELFLIHFSTAKLQMGRIEHRINVICHVGDLELTKNLARKECKLWSILWETLIVLLSGISDLSVSHLHLCVYKLLLLAPQNPITTLGD